MPYTIGQLAREAGVSVETIRYYERRGLLRRPPRPAHGYRRYDQVALERLRFIGRAKGLGFSLVEIDQLLQLSRAQCDVVADVANRKLERIRAQLADLRRLEGAVATLLRQCRSNSGMHDCPLIEALVREN